MTRRRRAVRLAAGIVAGVIAGSAPLAGAATPGQAGPATLLPAELSLHRITPVAPQPGDVLRLTGQVRNLSATTLTDLSAGLYLGSEHIGSRSAFDSFAAESPDDSFAADGMAPVSGATATLSRTSLRPNATADWSVSLPVDGLGLAPWEVYRLGVQVLEAGVPVGRLRTFLPYAPVGTPGEKRLGVAWLWPLVDTPHDNLLGTSVGFTDDALAGELTPAGRLGGLLAAAAAGAAQHRPATGSRHRHRAGPRLPRAPVPVTLAIDPLLLDEAARMATGYTVHGPTAVHTGTGRTAAAGFLSRLKALTGTDTVLGLPYADPDVNAAVRDGQAEQVSAAFRFGQTVLTRVLGEANLLTGWAWPPGGYADRATVDDLFASGIHTLVLDSGAMPPVGVPPASTPNPHVAINARLGSLTGVLADDTLSTAVTDGAGNDPGLALQRYLAETLMIQAEQPSTGGRSVLLAPARRWAPPPGYARRLLLDTGRVPWLRPVPLPSVAAGRVSPIARQLTYSGEQAAQEISPRYVREIVHGAVGPVNQLGDILPAGAPLVRQANQAILEALSSAWRDQPIAADAYRAQLLHSVAHDVDQVRIATAGDSLVTLTSHSGTVPITILNNLDQRVRVGIRLDTLHRLSITGGFRTYEIPAQQRVAVDVKATANVSGVFPVTASLYTPGPDAHRYGTQTVRIYVRSTAYGAVALAITGASFGLLLVAVGVRLARRAWAARRTSLAG